MTKLDPIEFIVKYVQAFVELWKMFGLEVVRETEYHVESAEITFPGGNQPIIEVHKIQGDENPGVNYVAFSEDIEGCAEFLKKKGIEHRGPNIFGLTGRVLLNFRDPDGYRAQSIAKPKDNHTNFYFCAICLNTSPSLSCSSMCHRVSRVAS